MQRFVVLGASLAVAPVLGAELPIDPRTSFLRANGETPPLPLVLDLSALGISDGDSVYLASRGEFNFGTILSDVSDLAIAVFSSSPHVDPNVMLLHRVPGAIDAGMNTISPPTSIGGLDTDIEEDFAVDRLGVQVIVPKDAAYLVVQASDSFFSDNSDIDTDFRFVVIRGLGPCVLADVSEPYGVLDLSDVNIFVVGFIGTNGISDLNDDNVWDLGDISLFVDAFLGGCP